MGYLKYISEKKTFLEMNQETFFFFLSYFPIFYALLLAILRLTGELKIRLCCEFIDNDINKAKDKKTNRTDK